MSDYEWMADSDSGSSSPGDDDEPSIVDDACLLAADDQDVVVVDFAQDEDVVQVLSTEDIVKDMERSISEVTPVIPLSTTAVRSLLHKFKWDKVALFENYYMEEDPEEEEATPPKKARSLSRRGLSNCAICLSDVPKSKMTCLECGHNYCNTCWAGYLTAKIVDNVAAVEFIPCPAPNCTVAVDDSIVFELIEDEKVKMKYKRLITNSFVEFNRLIKWCPGPGCTKAVKVTSSKAQPIECDCDYQFCFSCLFPWHEPVDCDMLRLWKKKAADDSETSNWIVANTKDCPKCSTTIEKSGGCNHITCNKAGCKFEFCWVCLGDWKAHTGSFYECNKFVYTEKDKKVKESRVALKKYLFYFNRYANHEQSLKFEKVLYEKTRAKMKSFEESDVQWIDVQFLIKALDVLCRCRRTLMHTYVLAFYLEKNNQTEIFEDNQKDLESTTEKLSHYLENQVTTENVVSLKQVIMDTYIYAESRREALLDHVKEAEEKKLWSHGGTP